LAQKGRKKKKKRKKRELLNNWGNDCGEDEKREKPFGNPGVW
jgi:hypothetical protein